METPEWGGGGGSEPSCAAITFRPSSSPLLTWIQAHCQSDLVENTLAFAGHAVKAIIQGNGAADHAVMYIPTATYLPRLDKDLFAEVTSNRI